MQNEAALVEEALRTAIQMETSSGDFYLKASENCGNEPGKKLFLSLAREENAHKRDFKKIYDAIRQKHTWPETEVAGKKQSPNRYLSGLTAETCSAIKPEEAEIEAVKMAIKMENESYDYYLKQLTDSIHPAAKEFYTAVAAAENSHRLALVEYLEFLENPTGYFVSKEHPTLD